MNFFNDRNAKLLEQIRKPLNEKSADGILKFFMESFESEVEVDEFCKYFVRNVDEGVEQIMQIFTDKFIKTSKATTAIHELLLSPKLLAETKSELATQAISFVERLTNDYGKKAQAITDKLEKAHSEIFGY